MRVATFVSLLITGITGCQTMDDDLRSGSVPIIVSASASSAIAGDITSRLAEQLPPSSTSLAMQSGRTDYAIALEAALKGWGYKVISGPTRKDENAVNLSYALQGADSQVMAQLSTPAIVVGRAYNVSPSGAIPASALSIMQRN